MAVSTKIAERAKPRIDKRVVFSSEVLAVRGSGMNNGCTGGNCGEKGKNKG